MRGSVPRHGNSVNVSQVVAAQRSGAAAAGMEVGLVAFDLVDQIGIEIKRLGRGVGQGGFGGRQIEPRQPPRGLGIDRGSVSQLVSLLQLQSPFSRCAGCVRQSCGPVGRPRSGVRADTARST